MATFHHPLTAQRSSSNFLCGDSSNVGRGSCDAGPDGSAKSPRPEAKRPSDSAGRRGSVSWRKQKTGESLERVRNAQARLIEDDGELVETAHRMALEMGHARPFFARYPALGALARPIVLRSVANCLIPDGELYSRMSTSWASMQIVGSWT